MNLALQSPMDFHISSPLRFNTMLIVALALHALLILGLSFDFFDAGKKAERAPSLDIILVNTPNQQELQDAEHLAQAANLGGGNTDEQVPTTSRNSVPRMQNEQVPDQNTVDQKSQEASLQGSREQMTQLQSDIWVNPQLNKEKQEEHNKHLDTVDIMSKAEEFAHWRAVLDRQQKVYSKQGHTKFIAPSTSEYKFAAYVEAWKNKVEKVGNTNFPDELRGKRVMGNVLLQVIIGLDGALLESTIKRSSGSRVMDDAALRIVRLAAPYAAIPKSMLEEGQDSLGITKTFCFTSNNTVYSC